MSSPGAVALREKASSVVLNRLNDLVERADTLAKRVEDRLSTVSVQVEPTNKPLEKTDPVPKEHMPPLFDEIRGRIAEVERSLERISDMIDRLEV